MAAQALALYGGLLYVADSQTGALFSINLATGSAAEVNGPATGAPVSLAVVDGGLLVGNTGRNIYFELLPGEQGTELIASSGGTLDFGGLAANSAGTAYYTDMGGTSAASTASTTRAGPRAPCLTATAVAAAAF